MKPPTAPFRPQARRALDVHRLEAAACAEARAERRRTEAELERLQVPCEYPMSTLRVPCEYPMWVPHVSTPVSTPCEHPMWYSLKPTMWP